MNSSTCQPSLHLADLSYIHRTIALLTAARKHGHFCHVQLSKFKLDLAWLKNYLVGWNGISLMRLLAKESTQITVTTDTSGSWGCGGYLSPGGEWFFWQWEDGIKFESIVVKELFPILLAAASFGNQWQGSTVLSRCDTIMAVVVVLRSRYASDKRLMHSLRVLFFMEARYNFYILAQHTSAGTIHMQTTSRETTTRLSSQNALICQGSQP